MALRYLVITVPLLIFGFLGVAVLAVAAGFAMRHRSRLARAVRVPGVIVSYREVVDSEGPTFFVPRVSAKRPSGEPFDFESGGSYRQPSPPPGTAVEVIVEADSDKAWLRGHEWRSFLPWFSIGGFMALGGCGIALVAVLLMWLLK